MEEKEKALYESIEKIDNKNFGVYFFTIDTKGVATASVANIYEHVKVLTDLGYKSSILHEKNDYHGVGEWLGEEYASLPHISIESQELKVSNEDIVIIPEVFANVIDQTKSMPCKRVILSQSYDYILELLPLGTSWGDYGIKDIITTSDKQKEYIKSIFGDIRTHIIPVSVPEYFQSDGKPKKPIVGIHTRNQRDTLKIIKAFYLRYPQFKWITFRDMRGLPRKEFASTLNECCVSVWVDDISSFGTFPIESMKCDVPVIGKVPSLIPEWMEVKVSEEESEISENGVWTTDYVMRIPDLVATYIKLWLEDSIPEDLYDKMRLTCGEYTVDKTNTAIKDVYENIFLIRKEELLSLLEEMNQKTVK